MQQGLGYIFLPLAFPLFWGAICLSLAQIGGWAALARTYATDAMPAGRTHTWCSARFGLFASYNSCLTFAFSPAGLYVRPMFLLRIGHKPLLIPWPAITHIKPVHWLFGGGSQWSVALPDGGQPLRVSLYGRYLDEALRQYIKG